MSSPRTCPSSSAGDHGPLLLPPDRTLVEDHATPRREAFWTVLVGDVGLSAWLSCGPRDVHIHGSAMSMLRTTNVPPGRHRAVLAAPRKSAIPPAHVAVGRDAGPTPVSSLLHSSTWSSPACSRALSTRFSGSTSGPATQLVAVIGGHTILSPRFASCMTHPAVLAYSTVATRLHMMFSASGVYSAGYISRHASSSAASSSRRSVSPPAATTALHSQGHVGLARRIRSRRPGLVRRTLC